MMCQQRTYMIDLKGLSLSKYCLREFCTIPAEKKENPWRISRHEEHTRSRPGHDLYRAVSIHDPHSVWVKRHVSWSPSHPRLDMCHLQSSLLRQKPRLGNCGERTSAKHAINAPVFIFSPAEKIPVKPGCSRKA